ncbi:MAG: hypothetical protein AUH85_07525 [Chloroflexi bacterium 13_1_40CM_4_68_4]|nr:MAG: hypothetical protein AUH85_07525 [Chloroflexi bacterium 13_1_40CM_4_68_4]
MDAFLALKFVHVLAAIVAVGFNASYGIWLARAAREERTLPFVLSTINLVDNIANIFYGLLLLTGLAMVFTHQLDLRTFWLGAALLLYLFGLVGIGVFVYRPIAARQRAALASAGATSAEFQRVSSQVRTIGILLGVIAVVIVFLMVIKPTLGA